MERSFDFGALLQLHEKKHKARPMQFVNVESGRQKRLENNIKLRKSTRLTIFDSIRNLQASETPKKVNRVQTEVEHRKMRLEKWKEEKEKKKKMAAAQKKKPFVTGIPHASLKYEPPPPPKIMPSSSGRVTRSQTSRATKPQQINSHKAPVQEKKNQSFAPKHATFKPPEMKNISSFPSLAPRLNNKKNTKNFEFNPVLPGSIKLNQKVVNSKPHTSLKQTESKKKVVINKKPKTPQKSIEVTKMATPINSIPKSESSSEERLRSPKSPANVELTPIQNVEEFKISPCVTISRGKDNARREMMNKIKEGLLDEDASNIDSVEHFKQQMDSEIKRITEMCDTWEKILEQTVLPENVQEAVLGAVGQARLLLAQKMQQFAALLARCRRPDPAHPLVTPADLHGFWDMLFMQVENVDMRFKKLEEMKARNWADEAPIVVQRRKAAPVRAAAKPAATSRIRDMIAAARKAKKQQSEAAECPPQDSLMDTTKTFEAGFFCVRSPVRQATPSTPNRSSLLKTVLSNEAKFSATKSMNSASLAILRASLISKNVDNEDVLVEPMVPLTPLNLTATPARSILKPLNTVSMKKSSKKSVKMVLFNESDAENENSLTEAISEMSVDVEKENIKNKRKSLVKQNAVEERSPVMTRSRRKSMSTPTGPLMSHKDSEEITPRRFSLRKRQELEN